MSDQRLVESYPYTEPETTTRQKWGVVGPVDEWVWMTFTTEGGARDFVRRHPDHQLVSQTITTVTEVTRSDWEPRP